MAYTSGTASHYKDLLSITATVAGANGWVTKQQTAELLYMMGTGLAGLTGASISVRAAPISSAMRTRPIQNLSVAPDMPQAQTQKPSLAFPV